MSKHAPPVTVMFPAFNADKYIAAAIQSFLDQTFTDFEMIISDNASEDNTEAICREFAAKDQRIRYVRNPVNIGANGNYRNILALSRGEYLLLASDHDLWRPDILEHYLEAFKDDSRIVLAYSRATIIAATGEVLRMDKPDVPKEVGRYSTFFNVFSGAINSTAINGLVKADALLKTSIHTSLGPDTLMLAELSLYGNFRQLPKSYYFRRQNRPPESPQESAKRYISMLFENPPNIIRSMPYTHMVYKALCMVQNNDLSFQDQKLLNSYILFVFTNSWGVTHDNLVDLLMYMKDNPERSEKDNTFLSQAGQRRQKPERMVLDMDIFLKTIHDGLYSDIESKYNARIGASVKHKQSDNSAVKKWSSSSQYDVCYLLYDAGKWGGVKGTIAQANGLVDRGYRVCIVCRTVKPDWIDVRTDFIVSPDLSVNDIPRSDIIVGTWFPTVPPGFSSKKGVCVHYCRGYEALTPGLSQEQKSGIEKVYNLPTIKIANSPHVGKFLKEHFPGKVYIVRNDIDHSIFYPMQKRDWGEDTIKVAIVGPYEVAWKGIRDCLEACRIFCKMQGIAITIIRASQTPPLAEENQLAQDIGCPYEYRFNLSEIEMASLYNACDILLSGSYPYVESFGRPAMEALACGLPVVLTTIPAYQDYDEKHDYALFVEPGNIQEMAEAMYKISKDAELRKQLIQRGIEVSSQYSIEKTIDDLDRTLQDIHREYVSGIDTITASQQYYGFSRPEVQELVNPSSRVILDVGCAAGELGSALKQKLEAEVWGVEIVEEIAEKAANKLDKVITGSIETAIPQLPDGYFDSIILADVIEHLAESDIVLTIIQSKLSYKGEIIASIPNVRHWSVLKDLIEGRWDYQDAGILDRTHLRFFTKKSIIDLFNRTGYSIVEMKATTFPGIGISKQLIEALSKSQLDISTLAEESSHYQYLVKAVKKKKAASLVSIVILTFNQLNYTKECVASINKHTPEPHEIIFVDNGSTDGTLKWLKQLSKANQNYKLIENAKNLGFAKGCNQGIEASEGEYILLLNNDVVVTEGWLSGMLECLNSSNDIGIVGPMTNNISGPQKVNDITYKSVAHLQEYAASFKEHNRYRRVPMRRIVGFCMLFRHELVDKVGLLDESFGTGNFEDDDFCLRSALEGYRNIIVGDVFIHHYGSRSFIGNRINYTETMSGNRRLFDEKWSGIDVNSVLGKKLLAVKALGMTDELFQKGDIEKAVQVLIEGIQHAPGDARLYYFLVDILMETKQFKEALDVIERMPVDASDARRLALTGYGKAGIDVSDEADEYADKALVQNNSSAMALNLKGIVAFKKGDKATAADYFEKAKKADPGYGEPYTNLGVIRWSAGNQAEGLDLLEKGFILSPMSNDAVDAYYSSISQTGSFDRMETTLRHASSLFPLSRRIAFLLIDCLIRQGKDRVVMLEIEQAMLTYGIDDGILSAALAIREKVGAKEIDASKKDATISLCMIVKNEESNLGKCLLSVESLVDEIIVVDTGSTDRTRDIAKAYGAKVYDFLWTHDFSAARNVSLSKARGDWILVLDADEVISPRDFDTLKKLIGRKKRENAYSITTRNYVDRANVEGWIRNEGSYIMEEAGTGWLPSFKVRLFPNDTKIRFENPVHELVEPSLRKAGKKILDCKVPIHHYGKLNSEKSLAKGEAYYQLGRKKLDEQRDEVMPLLELALQASELEKYEEAVDLLQRLLKIEPNSAKAHFNLGYLYLKLGNYAEGIRSSKRALEIDSSIKEAILNYASCEVYGGDVNNAITALEDMLKKYPGHPPATALLAMACIIVGKVDEGIACIEKIKKMKADCPGVILNHARELEKVGRIDFTSVLLETAVRYGYVNSGILGMLEGLKKR